MHRTEGTNNVANLFVDGPPGTTVEEDWLNAIQEEIAYSIEQAGITLKTAATETKTQFKSAIDALADTRIDVADLRRKNAIINGSMEHAQRGASGSAVFTGVAAAGEPINDDDTYLFDRWVLLSDGNDIVDVSQDTDVPTAPGALLSMKLDVETINKKFGILQVIEQKNAQRLIGNTVSLSFQAKVSDITKLDNIKAMVISWDGAADTVTSDIVSAWNAEDTTPTLVANWTAENTPANLGVTAAWAQYTITGISIDTAAAKNIGVFIWSDGFSDTLAKFLYITDVQLELGDVVTPFEYRLVGDELALCERYCCKSYDQNVASGTATEIGTNWLHITALANAGHTIYMSTRFPVTMRATPSVITYDMAGTAGQVHMQAAGVAATVLFEGNAAFRVAGTQAGATTIREFAFQYVADAEL